MVPVIDNLKKVNKDLFPETVEGETMSKQAVCDVCGGTLRQDTASLHLWHKKQLVIVCDVPAETCRQCGQSYVDREISARIEEFVHHCENCQPQRYIQVPEFSAAQILASEA